MKTNISHIFPQDFLQKLINFPKTTLENIFKLSQDALDQFMNNELNALAPLVCENACHIRAFTLWHMTQKYKNQGNRHILHSIMQSLNNIILIIHSLPPINKHTKHTIEHYLEENYLYLNLDDELLFDIKFIFLSHLLTLTKKQLPSSSFMLHEKTCLEALSRLGLVHNKIKALVSSAQKELSSMSCQFIQEKSDQYPNKALKKLLVTRYDDHKRSYLPQYSTAKIILLDALKNNIPLIIKISRFVKNCYFDEIILGFMPSPIKNDFYHTQDIGNHTQTGLICEGIINYSTHAESQNVYINRLNQYSLMQILLANFASHPQFSGNLKHTPCIYKEALEIPNEISMYITEEWNQFNKHANFAKKVGCSIENPSLLFLNHIFCDSIVYYPLKDVPSSVLRENFLDKNRL